MHHQWITNSDKIIEDNFQFPLLGIFPCTRDAFKNANGVRLTFQFPLLGIFPCTVRVFAALDLEVEDTFQFPLLGIFPCTQHKKLLKYHWQVQLSIPVTWDFSMHPQAHLLSLMTLSLSIPVTWDFSMHLKRQP